MRTPTDHKDTVASLMLNKGMPKSRRITRYVREMRKKAAGEPLPKRLCENPFLPPDDVAAREAGAERVWVAREGVRFYPSACAQVSLIASRRLELLCEFIRQVVREQNKVLFDANDVRVAELRLAAYCETAEFPGLSPDEVP